MQYRKTEHGYIIKLAKGEPVMETLTRFCEKNRITSGVFNGIGAVDSAAIGYYDLESREYIFTEYNVLMELVSMTGNVARVDDAPFLHVHAVLTKPDLAAFGGHVKEMTVGVTVEVFLTDYGTDVVREYDDTVGLKLFANLENEL